MNEKFQDITILYLYTRLSPLQNFESITSLGGAERRIVQIAVYFREMGVRVILASDDPDNSLAIKNLEAAGIECIRIRFGKKTPFSSTKAAFKLLSTIKKRNVDLIHSHHRWTTILSNVLLKVSNSKIPLIHNARNTFDNKRIFGRFAGNNIIAVSEGVKKNLISYFRIEPGKVTIIYNGISIDHPDKAKMQKTVLELKLSEQRIVSVIGRISKQKGHRFLIDALPNVVKKFPTLKVLFIGDEEPREIGLKNVLEKRANDLGIGANIIFLGYQEDIPSFIGISEFTVLPSLHEGLPGVVIESLLLRKPVIATDIGGTSEIITNMVNGILVEAKNSELLSNAIIYMLSRREEVKRMGVAGEGMTRERFAVPRMLNEYSEYYQSLLSSLRIPS